MTKVAEGVEIFYFEDDPPIEMRGLVDEAAWRFVWWKESWVFTVGPGLIDLLQSPPNSIFQRVSSPVPPPLRPGDRARLSTEAEKIVLDSIAAYRSYVAQKLRAEAPPLRYAEVVLLATDRDRSDADGVPRFHAKQLEAGAGKVRLKMEWINGPLWDEIMAGHEHFWIRGQADPESAAVAVKLVKSPPKSREQMAYESVMIGLKWSRMWDVVGDGNPFEQRPLYEVEGALWKKRIVETSPDHQS